LRVEVVVWRGWGWNVLVDERVSMRVRKGRAVA
jgi:hypothetical protein